MRRVILHSDLNNFYASMECLYNPAIRGNPVAVCGDPEQRHGIVLAKNDLAKKFEVKTGDPLWMAREIYGDYTDRVETFGLDECWGDLTGCAGLSGDAVAGEIRIITNREVIGLLAEVIQALPPMVDQHKVIVGACLQNSGITVGAQIGLIGWQPFAGKNQH